MAQKQLRPTALDPVWQRIQDDAREAIAAEPLIGGMAHASVLRFRPLVEGLE